MRLLPVRPDHECDRAARPKSKAKRRRYQQCDGRHRLSLRHLRADSSRDPRSREELGLREARMFTKSMFETHLPKRKPSRRDFLKASAATAGALVVATTVDFGGNKAAALTMRDPPQPNAFIKIAPDNTVTVMIKHLDMGQGNATGLTTIVADELDADWSQMRSAFAPSNPLLYNNLLMGPIQGTGGSTAIANSWNQLRYAGAAARLMLIAAASDAWGVPEKEITISKGIISHVKSGKTAEFGEFAAKAAKVMPPAIVEPKQPKDWVYIGKHVPRLDSVGKTTGGTIYAMDIKRP